MLLSSILLILLINNIYIQSVFFIILLISLILKKRKISFKKIKFLFMFSIFSLIFQIFSNKEGRILLNLKYFYISQSAVNNSLIILLKLMNLFIFSQIINYEKSYKTLEKYRLLRYERMLKICIKVVPDVFVLFKKKLNIKKTFSILLKKVYKEL